jgi:hypothetical protein
MREHADTPARHTQDTPQDTPQDSKTSNKNCEDYTNSNKHTTASNHRSRHAPRKACARHSQNKSKCPQDSLLGVSQNAEEILVKTMRGTPELLKRSPRAETRRSMIMPPCINPESGQLMTILFMVVVMMATAGCS